MDSARQRHSPPTDCGILPLLDPKGLGSASRTLGALIDIADQDRETTFKSLARIAHVAGISLATVKRHLYHLIQSGYIRDLGREKPAARRRARRTNTYRLITPSDVLLQTPYLPLPKIHRALPWSQAVVLAHLHRWAGASGHATVTARSMARELGLSLRTVKAALGSLQQSDLIQPYLRGMWIVVGAQRVEGCKIDGGKGAEMSCAMNLSLPEPNLETISSQQEHPKPAKPPAEKVVFSDSLSAPDATPVQTPNWRDIQPADLRTAESRRCLFFQAVACGVLDDSHENRVYFRACCIASLDKRNPGGYLQSMVVNRWKPADAPKPKPNAKPKFSAHHPLGHIDRSDLVDPVAAVELVESRLGPQGEYGRLQIAAEAKHALRVGQNAPAMFATNVAKQRWYATEEDEENARVLRREERRKAAAESPVPVELTNIGRHLHAETPADCEAARAAFLNGLAAA